MYGNTDSTCLIGNRTGNRLTNPPCSIGTEFKALVIVKFIYSLNQAQVALLNQIQKQHTATDITLGTTYYQTQVGFGQALLSFVTLISNCF